MKVACTAFCSRKDLSPEETTLLVRMLKQDKKFYGEFCANGMKEIAGHICRKKDLNKHGYNVATVVGIMYDCFSRDNFKRFNSFKPKEDNLRAFFIYVGTQVVWDEVCNEIDQTKKCSDSRKKEPQKTHFLDKEDWNGILEIIEVPMFRQVLRL